MPSKCNISGLYFDGKIESMQNDKTLKNENHLTILNEPGSVYVGHKAMAGHAAIDIKNAIIATIPADELQKVMAIGANGTPTPGKMEEQSPWLKNI